MWGWVFELIWHQWNWVKGLFSAEFYSKHSIRSRCVCSCLYGSSLLPRHHTITIPPPPDSPPSLYPLSCLATSFITSAVSVRERWSDLSLCLFCVCGPSAACLQHQVSMFVCVGVWKKMKGLWMAFHVKLFFFFNDLLMNIEWMTAPLIDVCLVGLIENWRLSIYDLYFVFKESVIFFHLFENTS